MNHNVKEAIERIRNNNFHALNAKPTKPSSMIADLDKAITEVLEKHNYRVGLRFIGSDHCGSEFLVISSGDKDDDVGIDNLSLIIENYLD